MAVSGQTGVQNVLEILRSGIDETLVGLGRASIHDLVPEDVIVPADFSRGRSLHAAASAATNARGEPLPPEAHCPAA